MRLFERIIAWFDDKPMSADPRIIADSMDLNPATGFPTIAGAGTPDVAGNPYGSTWSHDGEYDWLCHDRWGAAAMTILTTTTAGRRAAMIPGMADGISVLDRLVARWEVSRLNIVPFVMGVVSFWPMLFVTIGIAKAIGVKPIVLGRGMLVVWVALLVTEMGRGLWTLRHRYASLRWLRAVHAAIGDDVAVHALAELMQQHRYEPDYIVLRSDMTSVVQQERARRRDTAMCSPANAMARAT